jgi:DNA-binding NarL/FixJ family response regulator
MLRVVVAEDSYLIREGIRALLDTVEALDLVAEAATLPELLRAVEDHAPDVVVTDIRMPPGGYDEGIQAAEQLAQERPGLGVVVLSQYVEADFALRLLDGGARGVPTCSRSASATWPSCTTPSTPWPPAAPCSTRWSSTPWSRVAAPEVLAARPAHPPRARGARPGGPGRSNGAIAPHLVLSERAVEKHITAILTKLDLPADDADVHRRVRAVLLYLSETGT